LVYFLLKHRGSYGDQACMITTQKRRIAGATGTGGQLVASLSKLHEKAFEMA
jgi:hypothetical protein